MNLSSYSIQVFFDSHTETTIRAAWRELDESGVAPYLHQSTNRPHFTLSIYLALDLPAARRSLADLAARQAQLPISFPFYGIFPGPEPVVFLAPRVTEELLALQASLCRQLDELGTLPAFDYYRPACWVPHCALAMEFDGARLAEAVEMARRLPLPLDGAIREIGLTEMRPVRQLGTWTFAAI